MYATPLAQLLAALPPLHDEQRPALLHDPALSSLQAPFAAHPEHAFALLLPDAA